MIWHTARSTCIGSGRRSCHRMSVDASHWAAVACSYRYATLFAQTRSRSVSVYGNAGAPSSTTAPRGENPVVGSARSGISRRLADQPVARVEAVVAERRRDPPIRAILEHQRPRAPPGGSGTGSGHRPARSPTSSCPVPRHHAGSSCASAGAPAGEREHLADLDVGQTDIEREHQPRREIEVLGVERRRRLAGRHHRSRDPLLVDGVEHVAVALQVRRDPLAEPLELEDPPVFRVRPVHRHAGGGSRRRPGQCRTTAAR